MKEVLASIDCFLLACCDRLAHEAMISLKLGMNDNGLLSAYGDDP
jgi:hypothetical protein